MNPQSISLDADDFAAVLSDQFRAVADVRRVGVTTFALATGGLNNGLVWLEADWDLIAQPILTA